MGLFEALNKRSNGVIKEGLDLQKLEFKTLKDFVGQELSLNGFFFSNGKFGEQVCIITTTPSYPNGVKVNLPKRFTEEFKEIAKDQAKVEAILNGKVAITEIKEIDSKNGKSVSYKYKDII